MVDNQTHSSFYGSFYDNQGQLTPQSEIGTT